MIRMSAMAFLAAAFVVAPASGAAFAAEETLEKRVAKPLTPMGYLQQAAMGELFEIQCSKLAIEKARNKGVKSFAKKVIRDHSRTTQTLEKAAQSDAMPANTKMELPTRLDPHYRALMKQLEAAKGSEFDRLYVDIQREVHRQAFDLHRSYAKTGGNEDLRKMAGEMKEVVARHLEELERFASARPPKR